jgi:hypothetical protein
MADKSIFSFPGLTFIPNTDRSNVSCGLKTRIVTIIGPLHVEYLDVTPLVFPHPSGTGPQVVTLQLLWQEYRQTQPEGYGYLVQGRIA